MCSEAHSLGRVSAPQPARGGWHLVEWACEAAGTALLLLGGFSAIELDFAPGSPVAAVLPSHSLRLLLTGILFAGSGALVTVSPLGRRSGAHLNPAVTVAFWRRRMVHPHDLAGYVLGQTAGAFAATALIRWWWGAPDARIDVTAPGRGLGAAGAAGVEAAMTAVMVTAILVMVSSKRTAPWTPLLLWVVIAVLVWQGAPYTGTSLNPARSLAPAVLTGRLSDLWVYLVGPPLGAVGAAALVGALPGLETLTGKVFHDPRYRSVLASRLPVADAGGDPPGRRPGLARSAP